MIENVLGFAAVADKEVKMKHYALIVEKEVKLIIPWRDEQPPTPIEFCTAISAVWARSGADFSFGITPIVKEIQLDEKDY